jgi:hypothetical protein
MAPLRQAEWGPRGLPFAVFLLCSYFGYDDAGQNTSKQLNNGASIAMSYLAIKPNGPHE